MASLEGDKFRKRHDHIQILKFSIKFMLLLLQVKFNQLVLS